MANKPLGWLFGLLMVPGLPALGQAVSGPPAKVEFFSPQGTVKKVRQVAVRFTRPMVAFGDIRLPEPFDIACPAAGASRWADGRNWIYDFDEDLPAGVECRFTLKPGVRTLAGAALAGERAFSFNTGGPAIRGSLPRQGMQIDENQIFILSLDADATTASIERHAFCEVEGLPERIGIRLLTGAERKRVLDQRRSLGYQYFAILFKSGARAKIGVKDLSRAERSVAVVRCLRALPPGAKMRLVWGKGVATASGVATDRDQALPFAVRPEFTARFQCERSNANAPCLPMLPMRLVFSAPIPKALAARVRLAGSRGGTYAATPPAPGKALTVQEIVFPGPFEENEDLILGFSASIIDDAGRPLANAARFPLPVATDAYPPLAKFPGTFGIIELKAGAILPVTLRNLEAALPARRLGPASQGQAALSGQMRRFIRDDGDIIAWLKRVEKAGEPRFERVRIPPGERDEKKRDDDEDDPGSPRWKLRNLTGAQSVFDANAGAESFTLPKPNGAKAFEVVGIPLRGAGLHVVEIESSKLGAATLGERRPRYVATAALVTNLAAHFKWGRESSLVWVTTLDGAAPVEGAELAVRDCRGNILWQGRTAKDGIGHIPGGSLPDLLGTPYCTDGWGRSLFISARTADDMTFVRSDWNRGIHSHNFNLPSGRYAGPLIAHTVFARTLLRAGETVHMKHFFRRHTMRGFDIPQGGDSPTGVVVSHQGSGEKYEFPLDLGPDGTAQGEWRIPKEAKLGVYQVAYAGRSRQYPAGQFRVEAFRVPTMKALIQPPKEPLVNAREAQVDLLVSYLSGGGAAYAPVKLRTMVQPKSVSFADYPDFVFGGERVKEGVDVETPWWLFEVGDGSEAAPGDKETTAQVLPLSLDGAGAARAVIPKLPRINRAQNLVMEIEYQDASGELLTASNRVPLWPARVNLGIRTEGWVATKDRVRFQVIALDLAGRPVRGRRVTVDLFQKTRYSHRKRLIGGFYAYETAVETRRVAQSCSGLTNDGGLLLCELSPKISGELLLHARAADDAGNAAIATRSVWVAGGGEWWFEGTGSDRMDILPEKKSYESGETARIQVRMPFREATALVTVEREGVIDASIHRLSGREPIVEVPIEPNYAPNVFISVLAVRGRVGTPGPTALVDLGKPAFRLGMARLNVGWKPHALEVKVATDAETYSVRGRANVRIRVARAAGGRLPPGTEVAVAAVDEGLLELKPNESWKLLEQMMRGRGIEVETATAQMQVVGKRHYGKKAVPHGGGGGRQAARELFDTLLAWRGQVPLDANGEASLAIPLNDSLTSFRIVAIASGGAGLFGSGRASIRTTQDLMLHSGLPPLVREGDRFRGTVTVRNAAARPMTVELSARLADASGKALPAETQPAPQTAALAPGEAREVAWNVVAPLGTPALAWEVAARERGGEGADTLRVAERVIAAFPVRVYQATLARLEQPLSVPSRIPADAIPGRGGVRLELRAKLADNLAGVTEYMSQYPYNCYEQWVSQAVALRDQDHWRRLMEILPEYLDHSGLVKYFASDWIDGSDTLTAYVLAVAHEAGWSVPEHSLAGMTKALKGFVSGRIVRGSPLPTADLSIRKLAAIEALSRYGEASPEMLGSIAIEPNLWPTSAVLDWLQILNRLPGLRDRDKLVDEAEQILRSRLNFQGTTMGFSTERADALWWLMISPDVNAVRAVLALLDAPRWREDLPRMARGALGRMQRGHWNTTVANAWGMLAMEKFAERFEATPVSGSTVARLSGDARTLAWEESERGGALEFPWPPGAATLELAHRGDGAPWVTVQSRAALPLKAPLSSGYRIRRSVTPVERKRADAWSRGDVVRVKLELEAQSDMAWVVVEDPIPAGASLLGGGLGRDSALLARAQKRTGWAWLAFEERRFDVFRSYYRFVPKGKWSVEYTLRLNNPGTFQLPATRVEAMYAPEMFGETPNDPVVVRPGE